MKISEFLVKAKETSFWKESTTFCFRGNSYSFLFLRVLFNFLKKKEIVSFDCLRVAEKNLLLASLQQCFLGQKSFYLLGNVVDNISSKSKKNKQDVIDFLASYQGPHSIAFFLPREYKFSSKKTKNVMQVDLEDISNEKELFAVLKFFEQDLSSDKINILKNILKEVGTIPLDAICMFINYFMVTNFRLTSLLPRHFINLLEPEVSLYSLSEAFFSKKEKLFFKLWSECHNEYSAPFWIIYWSEQLWRAFHVTKFLKQNDLISAKKISFRLPFSFVKSGWKTCYLNELLNAHKFVYDIDFAVKTGASFCFFDFFYYKYFLGKFV